MDEIKLPDLPYAYNALEPVISEEIMKLHHQKHHKSYVDGANQALKKLKLYREGKEDINVRAVLRDLSFHLNGHELHSLFWRIMLPSKMTDRIKDLIEINYTKIEYFKKEFLDTAKTVEGSGWAIAARYKDNILILSIEKHNLMHLANSKVFLAIDVWEHAYYLQYKNDRSSYVDKWWEIVNWNEVDKILMEK
jgi:Fe-Mn family superoxide dismutase